MRPRQSTPFEELKERASKKHLAYFEIGEDNLNERGKAECRAYRIIYELFPFCENKADLVEHIRRQIHDMKAELQKIPLAELTKGEWREDVAVIGLLRRYIRFNCPSILWDNIPEFNEPTT